MYYYEVRVTGYSYQLPINFEVYKSYYTLIVDSDQLEIGRNGFIASKPISVNANLKYLIEVVPVNCAGAGKLESFYTDRKNASYFFLLPLTLLKLKRGSLFM